MRIRRLSWLLALIAGAWACGVEQEDPSRKSFEEQFAASRRRVVVKDEEPPPKPQKDLFPVPRPPFSEGIYPCTDCHEGDDVNMTRRELTDEHDKIKLEHGRREQWCFSCHNPTDRDKLRLASGTLVPFEESYRLCGQCHGPKYRDWRVGVHGRRTGMWNGKKNYLLCVHCHSPHSPRFKPLKPQPRPRRPAEIRP